MKRRTTHDVPQADLFGDTPEEMKQCRRPATKARAPSKLIASSATQAVAVTSGLLNVRQAATRLGLAKSTLDKMRTKGKGPRFIKSTERAVRYDPIDLDAWVANRRRQSTTDS